MSMKSNRDSGFGMIEVLVTLLIILIGLLGMAGLQGRALEAQMEAYQRSQALNLAKDMGARILANQPNAASYATAAVTNLGTGTTFGTSVCGAPANVQQADFCDWHTQLLGAAETSGGANVGAMIGARGCIVHQALDLASDTPEQVFITVAWQGLMPTKEPDANVTCGQGQYDGDGDGVADEAYRRVINVPLTIPN